ncbi:AT-hook motif nuclear-localized protein 1 [Euphorbia peplus]|nr:AT-hook motif nuclear-localized protein 1 [Euphorbia peplus]
MEDNTVKSPLSQLPSKRRDIYQPVHLVPEKVADEGANPGPGVRIGSPEAVSIQITVNKKRGRPRKYDHMLEKTTLLASPPPGFPSPLSVPCKKRGPGRPKGSGGGYAETAGRNLTPHVITIDNGQDIVKKIMEFTQKGYKAVCIISATGAVSSVVIRQPGSSGGYLRYEGKFDILTLTGTFTLAETTGKKRKNGTICVSLAKPDGRVFGGGVVGPLIASGPIQIIVGSFKQDISKELKKRRPSAESSTAACVMNIGGTNDSDNNNNYNNNENVIINSAEINNNGAEDQDQDQNCTTPTSAVMEPGNHVAANTDLKSDDEEDDDEDAQVQDFQVSDEINDTISIPQI